MTQETTRSRAGWSVLAALAVMVLVAACGSSSKSASSSSGTTGSTAGSSATTGAVTRALRVLVTNDDGFDAPGIDAVVQGLRTLPDVEVTVVAPATNQSGSGGKSTPGTLTVHDGHTASGYPAKAVAGYPADTVRWAIDDHGISFRPDVVVSGVNFGQNIGPAVDISGTVGAARAAASRGIPALAASAGFPPKGVAKPDFADAVTQVEKWITAHRAGLLAGSDSSPILLQNLNVPTCAPGTTLRGLVRVPVDANAPLSSINSVNCASTATNPTGDVQAFNDGFEPLSDLSVTP
jgi:5'-nucleotidase